MAVLPDKNMSVKEDDKSKQKDFEIENKKSDILHLLLYLIIGDINKIKRY